MGNLRDIEWPKSRRYKSGTEWEPAGFFSDGLLEASRFDLMLGFFSSTAINVLSDGFAAFIANGGRMRMIINDILSIEDWNAFHVAEDDNANIPYFDLSDIQNLRLVLSKRGKHFFECLSWMIRNNRIEIKIVVPQSGIGIAHTKCGLFSDGTNRVAFEGSCNFSRTALLQNNESLSVFCSWDGELDDYRIGCISDDFEKTFSGNDQTVKYLKVDDVATQIADTFERKELSQLIDDERKIINNGMTETVEKALQKAKRRVLDVLQSCSSNISVNPTTDIDSPHFPYPSGPREYQQEAFEKWKNNGQKGLFAMATGTGKTLTALNCLLEIYKRNGYYKALILVPTLVLVEQWENDCRKCGMNRIIRVCSSNTQWKTEIAELQNLERYLNPKVSYIIIATYASYGRPSVFSELNAFDPGKLLFIADEAHNMGGGRIANLLQGIHYARRIGLSATPNRQYDDWGNQRLFDFFGASSDFTFSFPMDKAIEEGFLCRYKYYPHVVSLTDDETEEYIRISLQLVKMFNFESGGFDKMSEPLKLLLLKRKRIIHKARNKERALRDIIQRCYLERGCLKYTLIYVPEGESTDYVFDERDSLPEETETNRLIDRYTAIVRDVSSTTTVRKFISGTTERDIMLKDFADGKLDVLTSMKCLDEGVDVPRSELAIFCSSTGNPRQFIQRRGRILRTHPDKRMAEIHDLVVVPTIDATEANYAMERSMIRGEMIRVRDFASLSENADATIRELTDVLDYYNLELPIV